MASKQMRDRMKRGLWQAMEEVSNFEMPFQDNEVSRALADAAFRSLRLAEDEGAVRAVAEALDDAIGERLDTLAATEDYMALPRSLLAAIDRYLTGEQEAG